MKNTNTSNIWRWIEVLRKGRQILFHYWQPSCYSCYKFLRQFMNEGGQNCDHETNNPYRLTKSGWQPENFRRDYLNRTTRNTKRNCISICCFSDSHAAVRCKRTDWLTRNKLLCPSEATCRSIYCWFNKLALLKSN